MDIPPAEVQRLTGFANLFLLLSFVLIVCNGSVDLLSATVSCLTWLEEWLLYFEWTWGRTNARFHDLVAKYKIGDPAIRNIIRQKRNIILKARSMWPFYATYEEDEKLRHSSWNVRYWGERIVFWDDTDIGMLKPSDAGLNRRTYSSYYGGNVAKGGVFIQLCGWLGVWELWMGAVSDTYYIMKSGILGSQKDFALLDLSSDVPFTNILDKGYRCSVAAWRLGQFVLQPSFAKSDQQFTTNHLLSSAAIATDRGQCL
uniref:DDE Tnp4 domain-containing protein n=1 Tax=Grammatophora oceanica TaxID=210454 RepID=A0A7S1UPM4_9STRA|mmetsp:Transcript_15666/g.23033  ORF Transcript_15666/g.23033 Transcript_15666/m.23033 type:complete len:257 (+) Transcript_15666:365-1135(+)